MTRRAASESRVRMPSGWLIGDDPAEARRYSVATLRPLRGYEEEWLADHRGATNAVAASRILEGCVANLDDGAPPRGFAARMLVGDREYLILQIRRLTLGDLIVASTDCPGCGVRMDVDFDAGTIEIHSPAVQGAVHTLTLPEGGGREPRSVRFRLPTGGDQEAVAGRELEAACEWILQQCLLDTGGGPLGPEESAAVIAAMEERAPRIDLELDLACPECKHGFVLPFDTTAFFLEEMRIGAAQLLREVHSLAFHYHWSESEILGLIRNRRRAYLGLLRDAMPQ